MDFTCRLMICIKDVEHAQTIDIVRKQGFDPNALEYHDENSFQSLVHNLCRRFGTEGFFIDTCYYPPHRVETIELMPVGEVH